MITPVTDNDESAAGAVARLVSLLDVEPLELNLFRGKTPDDWPGGRVFGGLVASQSLRAATATVDVDHRAHSFHSYFMRPGRNGSPIVYDVERVRDGKSFTTRVVHALQNGEVVFAMSASFHRQGEEGIDYQLPRAADAPTPERVGDQPRGFPMPRSNFFSPFDMRELGPTPPEPDGTYRSTRRVWVRTAAPLPDDPALHACVLAFMSDMGVVMAARPPIEGNPWQSMMAASLDHAIWFHRPVRADEWLFYDMHAVSTFNARGLVRGTMHTESGVLGASIAQEALVRPVAPGTVQMPPVPPPEL